MATQRILSHLGLIFGMPWRRHSVAKPAGFCGKLKGLAASADTTVMNVTGFQVDFLARLLDVTSLRHQVIAENVANVNTPGYHQMDGSFEDAFSKILASGRNGQAMGITPKVVECKGVSERPDGNNVDIDGEMGRLTKNTTLYNVYAQILAVQLAEMRSAISGQ